MPVEITQLKQTRVVPAPQAVRSAEGRDTAFSGDTGIGKRGEVAGFLYDTGFFFAVTHRINISGTSMEMPKR